MKLIGIAAAALALASSDVGQTPSAGSAERRLILDALRPAVEARLGPDVEFVVHELRVQDDWALVIAHPQRAGGRQIDGERYLGKALYDIGGLEVSAILRRSNAAWTVVDSAIGATDAWYCGGGAGQAHPFC